MRSGTKLGRFVSVFLPTFLMIKSCPTEDAFLHLTSLVALNSKRLNIYKNVRFRWG